MTDPASVIKQQRRFKIISIDERVILHWLIAEHKEMPKHLIVPMVKGIPQDIEVISVHHDYISRLFDFVISHPSFEEVPPGETIPRYNEFIGVTYQMVELKHQEDFDIPALA